MDSNKLVEVAISAVIGALTKVAVEPALSAGQKVWAWAKAKLSGPQAAVATALETAPEDPGTVDSISGLLKSVLHRDPAAAEELFALLGHSAEAAIAVAQTANVSGVGNSLAQVSGHNNVVVGGSTIGTASGQLQPRK